ncbi:hypothetical protein HK101_011324 [Irineochytrium annulatum]|nr:hypothetical protein HK101_011324 [Irineochytrium annulatum]
MSQPTVVLYPLAGYQFGVKDAQPEEDPSVQARLSRLQLEYDKQGMRETVEGVPGDSLKPGEDEIEGLKARLNARLGPPGKKDADWEIGELLAVWWRPNFETYQKPKERKKMFLVHLPEEKLLSVPKNMKLLAVPLFELYDNAARYGPQLSALPHLLSRFNFVYN